MHTRQINASSEPTTWPTMRIIPCLKVPSCHSISAPKILKNVSSEDIRENTSTESHVCVQVWYIGFRAGLQLDIRLSICGGLQVPHGINAHT